MAYNLYLIEDMNSDYEYVLWKDVQDVLWWRWNIRKITLETEWIFLSEWIKQYLNNNK